MFYNAKEFLEQDLRYKGPMRRRYDELLEIYKGYIYIDITEENGRE